MRLMLAPAVCVLGFLAATPAGAEVWTRSFEIPGRPTVRVVTDDARVRVHTRPAGPVEYKVEYTLRKVGLVLGARKAPHLRFEQSGSRVTLTTEEPNVVAIMASVETRFQIDVTVPIGSDVEVRTRDGAIECDALHGSGTFETGDGAVRLTACEGTARVVTGDGAVDVTRFQGRLDARTADGRVRADGVFERLDVASGDGRVEVVVRPGSRLSDAWNLETRDGSLTLRVPATLAAMLDARTADGTLRVDLPIAAESRSRRHDLVGELNGGGPRLRLRTGDGTLRLALTE